MKAVLECLKTQLRIVDHEIGRLNHELERLWHQRLEIQSDLAELETSDGGKQEGRTPRQRPKAKLED